MNEIPVEPRDTEYRAAIISDVPELVKPGMEEKRTDQISKIEPGLEDNNGCGEKASTSEATKVVSVKMTKVALNRNEAHVSPNSVASQAQLRKSLKSPGYVIPTEKLPQSELQNW